MKTGPREDYPVWVAPCEWDEDDERLARLYRGAVRVELNRWVDIALVPDLSDRCPPWDGAGVPVGTDPTEPWQAWEIIALTARYVVTPNVARAGQAEVVVPFPDEPDREVVVWYVGTDRFAAFADELERLRDELGVRFNDRTVSMLRHYDVIRFLESAVVASGLLKPDDARLLGRPF